MNDISVVSAEALQANHSRASHPQGEDGPMKSSSWRDSQKSRPTTLHHTLGVGACLKLVVGLPTHPLAHKPDRAKLFHWLK